ncbi:peptidase [Anoxybacteroides amylolyticum]|uniref:Peptidase, ArgE/DapE family protein n=1 Tax=Anoxybacteroides amylolyticum TaxID=294699 RepID=A0A160F6D1_9BACL|nr:peptidase [Anoxybacillus amylolyticus]ANB61383.1 peptidase, ArgE/DapE family protein [Anoxybacillus amylolyticus]
MNDLHRWFIKKKKAGIELLRRLVQEASTQTNEATAQALIIEKCRQLQLELDIWEPEIDQLKRNPYFVSTRTTFLHSPNVVAVWKGTGGGRSLILNSHIDVVPEGDVTQWKEDPYSGKVEDGKLYGRGASDMKGGTVALLLAIEALKTLGVRLKGDVIFQSVIEEESGGAGTLAAILRGYRADGAIIPEPTDMKLFPTQQGSLWFRITVRGKSAHGGTRYEGVSAIEKAWTVVRCLQQLETKRNERIDDPLYAHVPIPIPINIGTIRGGTWPSSVPDCAVLEGRMGVAPNETIEQAKHEMKEALCALGEQDEWLQSNIELEWFGAQWLPSSLKLTHPLLQTMIKAYRQVKGEDPIIEAAPWGTDGGLLTQVGAIPTIVFGPGTTAVAHYPNEYIAIDRVLEAAEMIAYAIMDWCGVEES